ncbi:MAG: Mut7-C RNAse domain-containing protein [Desulfurococcales archaeon]|nr:Mut7-C RNAse domain-containing protein [Desulfurococcales archaeon]
MVKFIVDSMLGDVARWLRMLGYDTLYSRRYEDWRVLQIAEKEGRTIITRDRGLFVKARKRGINAVLIYPEGRTERVLAKIAVKTGIKLVFDPSKTRCPYCNVRLERLSRAEALSLVPPKVAAAYDTFWRCPKCGRIYWKGSHWRTIDEVLKKANDLIHVGEWGS